MSSSFDLYVLVSLSTALLYFRGIQYIYTMLVLTRSVGHKTDVELMPLYFMFNTVDNRQETGKLEI